MTKTNYQCKYCSKRFVHEDRYLNHHCQTMKREEIFRQPIGQAAWIFYQDWMKSYNKLAPNADGFLSSRFYNSFIRFAEFVKQVRMVDPAMFITIMREHDIHPTIWTKDQVYSLYLEHMDKKIPPEKRAETTINTLFDIAEAASVSVENVFDTLTPSDLIQLLRERRVSPWILLNSSKFSRFFKEKTSVDDRIIMESIIRPKYWKEKFEKNPDIVKQMKAYVRELNI